MNVLNKRIEKKCGVKVGPIQKITRFVPKTRNKCISNAHNFFVYCLILIFFSGFFFSPFKILLNNQDICGLKFSLGVPNVIY